jgi:hypothetical protein
MGPNFNEGSKKSGLKVYASARKMMPTIRKIRAVIREPLKKPRIKTPLVVIPDRNAIYVPLHP